ncbi:unnamed protein product [Pleuronectes platessa]|uniref:Uncharacterized protein n=1 Tax=Pleuronectes platessa TaxID=8262 RepID=A0A9N7UBM7_PLEPL|nr:unnamed protein product [Pleuronectes platessa]
MSCIVFHMKVNPITADITLRVVVNMSMLDGFQRRCSTERLKSSQSEGHCDEDEGGERVFARSPAGLFVSCCLGHFKREANLSPLLLIHTLSAETQQRHHGESVKAGDQHHGQRHRDKTQSRYDRESIVQSRSFSQSDHRPGDTADLSTVISPVVCGDLRNSSVASCICGGSCFKETSLNMFILLQLPAESSESEQLHEDKHRLSVGGNKLRKWKNEEKRGGGEKEDEKEEEEDTRLNFWRRSGVQFENRSSSRRVFRQRQGNRVEVVGGLKLSSKLQRNERGIKAANAWAQRRRRRIDER